MNTENFPETLHEIIRYFDADTAHDFFVSLRWPDGKVTCPRCDSARVSFISTRKVWTCMDCKVKKQFSVKVGSIFEGSPITLDKWFAAMWLLTNAKNGISSYEIHRSIKVTQKTAWFMMHRIRVAMQTGSFVKSKLTGTVEVDESYIGGKARNMHAHVKREKIKGTLNKGLTPVQGLLERSSKDRASRVVMEVVDGTKRPELQGNVRKYVLKGTEVHTDALRSYTGLAEDFTHKVVDHAECYVKDGVHTNGLENFWSLLKRGIKGTYVSIEPFHLFRYLGEQVFRFNERKDKEGDKGRFLKVIANVFGKRLTYKKLIGDNDALPATA
jgi:transposase-like protein